MDRAGADEYLRRMAADRPAAPDAAALRTLQLQHLRTVPFENLSVHLGEPVVLTERALTDKLVRDRRGGFCYELNGVFAALLTALGYDAALLAARVFEDDGSLGIPYDHAVVRVRLPGGPVFADVGFGRHSHYPLRLDMADEQPDPGGVFRVQETPEGDIDVLRDGAPRYRVEPRPRVLADFEADCWWHTTSPKSHFTRSPICSRLTADGGRITLSGRTFTTTAADGSRTERVLPETELLPAYRTHFGITLDRAPALPAAPEPH